MCACADIVIRTLLVRPSTRSPANQPTPTTCLLACLHLFTQLVYVYLALLNDSFANQTFLNKYNSLSMNIISIVRSLPPSLRVHTMYPACTNLILYYVAIEGC